MHYYPTAIDKVRFVGEPVAVVVARDRYLAEDAAEMVGGRLRAAAGGGRSRAGAGAGRADPAREGRLESRGQPAARLRRSRRGVRRRRRGRARALPVPQVQLHADRDLWRDRALGPARRRADDLVQLHGAVHHASAGRAGAGAARESPALHRADRHRRLVRDQVQHLSVHGPDRPGRHEDRRAGEVDRGPARAPAGVLQRHRPDRLARGGGAARRHDPRRCASSGTTTSAGTSGARSRAAASAPPETSSARTASRISRSTPRW